MIFFRENTAEEFIDALGPQDIEFAKKLMKNLLHKHLNEEKMYEDEETGEVKDYSTFFDSEEYFKGEINYYFNKKREAKNAKKLIKRKRKY